MGTSVITAISFCADHRHVSMGSFKNVESRYPVSRIRNGKEPVPPRHAYRMRGT